MVAYDNKNYYIDIIETMPFNTISIIEADCQVDFAPSLDYKESEKPAVPGPRKARVQGLYQHFVSVCLPLSTVVCNNMLNCHVRVCLSPIKICIWL